MVKSTEEKLRQERANLWRAKNLSRQFMGDESWIPLECTEGPDDWDLFEPKPKEAAQQATKKRKREVELQNGINGHDYADSIDEKGTVHTDLSGVDVNSEANRKVPGGKLKGSQQHTADVPREANGEDDPATEVAAANGVDTENAAHGPDAQLQLASSNNGDPENGVADAAQRIGQDNGEEHPEEVQSEDEEQPLPTRRITRALAAEHNSSAAASPPQSPISTNTTIDSDLQPDPVFLLPPILSANHRTPRSLLRLGIPVDELMETRRLLMMYIQKQEESVRGYEAVLGKLIKAKRMRDKLWQWAKTEGHIGELSDGEDWIDTEAWGLGPGDLKKGADEDNTEAQEETGRKGKRRRRD
jgi:hypothetical protein